MYFFNFSYSIYFFRFFQIMIQGTSDCPIICITEKYHQQKEVENFREKVQKNSSKQTANYLGFFQFVRVSWTNKRCSFIQQHQQWWWMQRSDQFLSSKHNWSGHTHLADDEDVWKKVKLLVHTVMTLKCWVKRRMMKSLQRSCGVM